MKRLIIIGAGGHGKVVADIAMKCGYKRISFVDDNTTGIYMEYPILGTCEVLQEYNDGETDFVLAVGNNKIRQNLAERLDLPWTTLVHPSAQIGTHVCLGTDTVVMAGAIINPGTAVGKHCIINTHAVVEHDCHLSDYVHISPNAALGGTVHIGAGCHIGIGATVKNNVTICEDCVIGAGAVVVGDVPEPGTYVGVPAHRR